MPHDAIGPVLTVRPGDDRRGGEAWAIKERITHRSGRLPVERPGFEAYYRRHTDYLYVEPDTGDLLGYAVVKQSGYVSILAVDPAAWRQGVGSALVEAIADDYPVVSLHVVESNDRAREFYEAQGFEVIRTDTERTAGGENALLLRRYPGSFTGDVLRAIYWPS